MLSRFEWKQAHVSNWPILDLNNHSIVALPLAAHHVAKQETRSSTTVGESLKIDIFLILPWL